MTATPVDLSATQYAAFAQQAERLAGIDLAVYAACERDWRVPVLGLGPANAPLCIFGRDPGRTEVERQHPFVGRGGQLLRAGLHQYRLGLSEAAPAPTFDEALAAGGDVFWLNTVPYKPLGNKAWSMVAKRRFQPAQTNATLQAFWLRSDRYSEALTIDYQHDSQARQLVLAPLPHPSPANAVWFGRFAALLTARLNQLAPAYRK